MWNIIQMKLLKNFDVCCWVIHYHSIAVLKHMLWGLNVLFPLLQSYPNFPFRTPSYQTSGSRKSQNLDIFVHPFPSISSYFHPFHSMSYCFHFPSMSSYFISSPFPLTSIHFSCISIQFDQFAGLTSPYFSHIFPYFLRRATPSRTSTAASSSSRLTARPQPRPWSRGLVASWPSAATQRIRTRSERSSHGEAFLHRKRYRKMWEDSGKLGKIWENWGSVGKFHHKTKFK